MSLSERLDALKDIGSTVEAVTAAPRGWEPGVKYEPDGTQIVTLPPSSELQADGYQKAIEELGLVVPDGFRVRLVEAKYDPAAWGRDHPEEAATTRAVWRYRFIVEPAPAAVNVDDLIKSVKQNRKIAGPSLDGAAFVFVVGDLQIGKPDGDGSAGTVERFYESLDRAVTRAKYLKRKGLVTSGFLAFVGDCPEGTQSQGGNLIARLDLTLTEQIRVLRRLFADEVQAFAQLFDELTVAAVPGNHGEATRVGNQMASRYDDSWDIEILSQVADVMAHKGYNVDWLFPGIDGLHVVADVKGTSIGLLHGHQTRGKMQNWLANKAMNRDAIGTADVVLSGHHHHLRVEQMGPTTWMQTGSLDGGSAWWVHKGGLDAPPAAVTFATRDGRWEALEIV
jgi:hypothetical protein